MADDPDPRATLVTTSASAISMRVEVSSEACLVIIYGADIGKRLPLGERAIEFGRSRETDVPLDDDSVSRRHARIAWTGAGYVVSDLGSTNGTYVNDAPVRDGYLRDGDQIKIGKSIFKFLQGGNVELAYHEEIYRLMTFDGLTQINNKRSFEVALERHVVQSRRYARPLSLALFDLDHFKTINDKRGHLAGDAVLRQLANIAKANVRPEDVLARVGGEEFALLMPEIDLETARRTADHLRTIVERTTFSFENNPIPVTSSFGVAALDEPGTQTPAELYAAADERLYAAKKSGRNRVV